MKRTTGAGWRKDARGESSVRSIGESGRGTVPLCDLCGLTVKKFVTDGRTRTGMDLVDKMDLVDRVNQRTTT